MCLNPGNFKPVVMWYDDNWSTLFCQLQKKKKDNKVLNFLGSLDICSMSEEKSEVAPTAELPTYVNTQHINREDLLALKADAEITFSGAAEAEDAEASSPGKDLFDMSEFPSYSLAF